MSQTRPTQQKMLPGDGGSPVSSVAPARQLSELPRDELEHLAEEYGLDPHDYRTPQALVAAIHDRRQMIASLDRDAMLDVIKWGRRPVAVNASKEQLALEIARTRSMRFSGLSHRGLVVLARMRGAKVDEKDPVPVIIRRLKRQEGFFTKLNRKRRAFLGSIVANLIGGEDSSEYQFLPPAAPSSTSAAAPPPQTPRPLKHEIEEAGLIGGLAGRIKQTADQYLNQKLDEIESRIDRKLDEIDRRLAEWRDKEVANRLRILKITLWASLIVAGLSLIYSYVTVHFVNPPANDLDSSVPVSVQRPHAPASEVGEGP